MWIDRLGNLAALASTDAEFDHFEAATEPYAANLGVFPTAAARAELGELNRLNQSAKSKRLPRLAISDATLIDSNGAPAVQDSVILIEDGVIT